MAAYRFSIHVEAPVERVFTLWTDHARWREWIGGVERVTDLTGPTDAAGTRYTIWFGRMESHVEVLEATRPRHIRTRLSNRLLSGEANVSFAPDHGGTAINQEFRPTGLISRVAARIFATGRYAGSFRGELEAFRKLAEDERSAAPT
jgi:uncharacterized protein YndB with AHSA1/START domain